MTKLKEVSTLLTNHSNEIIFYDKVFNKFIITSSNKLTNFANRQENDTRLNVYDLLTYPDRYIELFSYKRKDLMHDVNQFIELNPIEDFKDVKNVSFSTFKKIIKKNNLFDKWIEYFSYSLCYELFYWCYENNIKDDEAESTEYEKIKVLFDETMTRDYASKLTYRHLYVFDDFYPAICSFYSSDLNTKGILFYLGNGAINYHKFCLSFEDEKDTASSLSQTVTLIKTELQSHEDYGGLMSMFVNRGITYNCFLPQSVALMIIRFLNNILECTPDYLLSDIYKEADNEIPSIVYISKNNYNIKQLKGNSLIPSESFYDTNPDAFINNFKKLRVFNCEYDFSFNLVDEFIAPNEEDRIYHHMYACCFCDHETGEVIYTQVIDNSGTLPFKKLAMALLENIQGKKMANVIYVNNPVSLSFLYFALKDYCEDKKIRIELSNEALSSDSAIEGLSFYDDGYYDYQA